MKKLFSLFLIFALFLSYHLVLSEALAQNEERITISTYYPSPYGSYRDLSWGDAPPNAGRLTPDQGSSIELGGTTNSTPYIDFHRGPTAGTGSVDYNARMILETDKKIGFYSRDSSGTPRNLVNILDDSGSVQKGLEIPPESMITLRGNQPGRVSWQTSTDNVTRASIYGLNHGGESKMYIGTGVDPSHGITVVEHAVNDQRVGINKIFPDSRLHVYGGSLRVENGDIRLNNSGDNLYFSDSSVFTSARYSENYIYCWKTGVGSGSGSLAYCSGNISQGYATYSFSKSGSWGWGYMNCPPSFRIVSGGVHCGGDDWMHASTPYSTTSWYIECEASGFWGVFSEVDILCVKDGTW